MDIQEIIKYSKNKIEADDLAKQVRRRIKETAWEKQNRREGFSETFKPLISQFEKPEDSKKENIFTQNQKMLRNQLALTEGLRDTQLALTEGLRDNQKAITEGFKKYERLPDMKELPQIKSDDDDDYYYDANDSYYDYILKEKQSEKGPGSEEPESEEQNIFYLANRFKKEEIEYLYKKGLYGPHELEIKDKDELKIAYDDANDVIKSLNGILAGKGNKVNKNQEEIDFINKTRMERKILVKYKDTISDIIKAKEKYKTGKGIFFYSPQELIKRFELLGGSLAAGNNGVLNEYIQIAHRLRDLGVVTNNQLNKLLRNYLNIR